MKNYWISPDYEITINGMIILRACINDDFWITEKYIGYSLTEAKKLFKALVIEITEEDTKTKAIEIITE